LAQTGSPQFVDAAHETGKYKLTAIYSRSLEQAQAFASDYPVEHLFTSLDDLAQSDAIDAVYIASPNSLHFPQTKLFLSHKKHVICEKPLASNLQEVEAAIRSPAKTRWCCSKPSKPPACRIFCCCSSRSEGGKLRKAFINYCQYSSRYQRYLDGENPNTFNPAFSNGSIMDIGFYCLASAVALWGEPRAFTPPPACWTAAWMPRAPWC
jgi:predicted dehydrogenase